MTKEETTGVYTTINGKKTEIQKPVDEVIEMYRSDPSLVYSKEFFERMQKLRLWQKEVGRKIVDVFGVKSVGDFGCGAGYYLEGMHENGAEVAGYEYMYKEVKGFIPDSIKDRIFQANCQNELDIVGSLVFDMTFSIEVAEHVLPEYSSNLVWNLTDHANKFIVFSAAPPGQTGCGHINLQPLEYWVELFNAQGWVESKEWTEKLRDIYRNLQRRSKYTNLLARMTHVFVKGEKND